MYVCICNAVSDADIRAEISLGADSVEALGERLQVGRCCGSCREETQAMLDSARDMARGSIALALPEAVLA